MPLSPDVCVSNAPEVYRLPFDVGPRFTAHAPKWFALRVRAQFEFKVRDSLETAGLEAFLATWSEEVQWSDRKKTTVRPLFPGYVFARMDGFREFNWALQTRGVVQILPDSLNPLAVSDAEIATVKRVMDAKVSAIPCDFTAGETVTIDNGPLAGVSGVVVKTKGSMRVVVSVEILRRAVSVELDAGTLLKKAEA